MSVLNKRHFDNSDNVDNDDNDDDDDSDVVRKEEKPLEAYMETTSEVEIAKRTKYIK